MKYGGAEQPPFRRSHRPHGLEVNPSQQCKQARDQQALNMVGMAVIECLGDLLPEAIHVCLGSPVELRQRQLGIQEVPRFVLGHVPPVDTTDVCRRH